jgi:hypothetical protein
MARVKRKPAKIAKYRLAIAEAANLIVTGRLLAIDPSVGSANSMPGYAVFEAGKLVENGTIQVDHKEPVSKRLHEINRCLREDFERPDVVAIEMPPLINLRGMGHRMNAVSRAGLQRGIGAAIAAWPVDHIVEIPPASWSKFKPADYVKGDAQDALVIGLAVLALAARTPIKED